MGHGSLSWSVGLLVARNLLGPSLPPAAYVPTNALTGAMLVGLSRRDGRAARDLGLDRRWAGRGARSGAAAGGLVAAGMVAASVAGPARRLFDDERVEPGRRALLHETLLRIPVGTVAFEELAFRGVLLAQLRARLGTGRSVAVGGALFGLWHVVPTVATADANGIEGRARAVLVAASVAATAVAGAALSGLRIRSGHLLAPALAHLASNDVGYVLAARARSATARATQPTIGTALPSSIWTRIAS